MNTRPNRTVSGLGLFCANIEFPLGRTPERVLLGTTLNPQPSTLYPLLSTLYLLPSLIPTLSPVLSPDRRSHEGPRLTFLPWKNSSKNYRR